MFQKIKQLFRQRTPLEVITQELAVAHLEMLDAQTGVDYAQSIVDYNINRIERLNKHIATYSKQENSK